MPAAHELAGGIAVAVGGAVLGLVQLADVGTLVDAAGKVGVPAVALFCLGVGVYRACQWIGREVVKPMLEERRTMTTSITAAVTRQADAEVKQTHVLERLENTLVRMERSASQDRRTIKLALGRLEHERRVAVDQAADEPEPKDEPPSGTAPA